MSRHRALAGLGLVLAAGALAVSAGAAVPPPHTEPQRPPAAVNAGADDWLDARAHNSPSLARNPVDADNLVAVNRVDMPGFDCGLHVSVDGGASWREGTIPRPPGTEPTCYAPDVAFGPDGTLFVSFVMLAGRGNVPDSVWLTSSEDGGATLSEPRPVAGELAFQTRLVAHPSEPGRLALTWVQAEEVGNLAFPGTGYPVVAATSDDGGSSWEGPYRVSDGARERVLAPVPAYGDDGELFVLHLDVLDDRLNYHGGHGGLGGPAPEGPWELVLTRSTDGGRTWGQTTVADDLVPIERYLVFLPPAPALAVDGDRVYAGFHDARLGDPDVWLWASSDGGGTWGAPVRVNDTAEADGTSQYLPALATADGRLDVLYYDRRGDPEDRMNAVSLQHSRDGGRTFSERLEVSDGDFDSQIGFGAARGMPDLGSRLALESSAERALAVWTDTSEGTPLYAKQNLMYAPVVFVPGEGGGLVVALRLAAAALLAAGVATVAWPFVRRRVRRVGSRGRRGPGRPGGSRGTSPSGRGARPGAARSWSRSARGRARQRTP